MQSWMLLILYATLGTGHCMAMCGGFAIMATRNAGSGGSMALRFGLYLLGKGLTYFFLVLTMGVLTDLARNWLDFAELSYYVGIIAGVGMIGFGIRQAWLFIQSRRSAKPYRKPGEDSCQVNGKLRLMRNPLSAFVLGWGNGFLPCGFLWLALIYISQWPTLGQQLAAVLVFTLLTSPGLIAAVGVSRLFKGKWLRWSLPVSSCALCIYGVILVVNAMGLLPHSVHQALAPVSLPLGSSHQDDNLEWCISPLEN